MKKKVSVEDRVKDDEESDEEDDQKKGQLEDVRMSNFAYS